jgi:hypothetical protein
LDLTWNIKDLKKMTFADERCLIHFHIPRTGGTWLRQSLIQHLLKTRSPDQIFFVGGVPEWGCAFGTYQDLLSLSPEARSRLRLVTGHMPIGVLDLFQDAYSVTVMRDPLERSISDYWYCFRAEENPAHASARALSLVEFCIRGFSQARNGQARYLSGGVFSSETIEGDEMLRRAKTKLARFDLVGILDDICPFLNNLEMLGLRGMKTNGFSNKAARCRQLSAQEISTLKNANLIDYELYDLCCTRSRQHLGIAV